MERIETKLNDAGFKMFGLNSEIEELIISILKTNNTRYLKAIPFLIYLHKPNSTEILSKLKNEKKYQNLFREIIKITRQIFKEEEINIDLPKIDTKTNLNYSEFKDEFELQKNNLKSPSPLLDKEKIYAERSLQISLSYIFTKKERDIINKILESELLTKTEYEYYSRKTKKKLNAILNLQTLTKALLPIHPRRK